MTLYTYDDAIASDLYKDVYGTRSVGRGWNELTPDQKQAEWDSLLVQLERNQAEEAEAEAARIAAYEARLHELETLGAKDRAQAITWLLDSMDEDGFNGDAGYACYLLGLPYRMESEFQPYMKAQREARS